jgi:hypothetical protein
MNEKNKRTKAEYEKMGRMLEDLYTYGKISPGRFVWLNFARGVIYGFGLFLGGTIVVAVILSVLNMFDQVPVIGPFVEKLLEATSDPTSTIKNN